MGLQQYFIQQAKYYEEYNILISYFSYKDKDVIKFRIYFKDLNTGFLFNPIPYRSFTDLIGALKYILIEIQGYKKIF